MGSKRHRRRDNSYDSKSRSRHETKRSKKKHHKDRYKHRRSRSYSSYGTRKYQRSTHHKHHKKHRDYSRRKKYQYSRSPSSSRSKSSNSRSPSGCHYKFRVGEYLGRKYRVKRLLGDGTFGRVVEAERDRKTYAVKIIKAVQRYIDSARTEKKILKFVNSKDPEDRFGIVRYVQSFEHYKNYCLVFEPLGRNLYDVLKNNNYKGFPIHMVRSFFRQILVSVGFLHSIGYTHTDLKPENVLLEKTKFRKEAYPSKNGEDSWIELPENDTIRIIDFGGATENSDHHSKIINTRQYRSPEVILGCCEWSTISDVWSIGCIIAELYTGELYFPTHENIEHLRMIQKHCGSSLPGWMVQRSEQYNKYFVEGKLDWPKVSSGKQSIQSVEDMETIVDILKPHKDMLDLLLRCLDVDPRSRITCAEALKHPFFSEF